MSAACCSICLANQPQSAGQSWNLKNADIRSVIATVSKETGKNFVVDPRVNGQVNLISSSSLSSEALYSVFLSVLDAHGFSAVEAEGVIKIIPNTEAVRSGAPFNPDDPNNDDLVIRVFQVHNISAIQIVGLLRPLIPQWAQVNAYGPSNILIFSGHAGAMAHLIDLVKDIDISSETQVDIVQLETESAFQVAEIVTSLQGGNVAQNSKNHAKVIADEKNNRILISGDKMSRLQARLLIEKMDETASADTDSTEVIYLRYLKAKDFAPILEKIARSMMRLANSAKPGPNDAVQIQAELESNSLIVSAPLSLTKTLKHVIAKLDIRPSQVLVQAVIVELSASSTEKLGIQWGMEDDSQNGTGVDASFQSGLGVGVIRAGNFRALVSAIKGISNADVLSQPTIVVLDNSQAVFSVGKQVSVIKDSTGAANAATSEGIPFTTSSYDRENVGLELDVTPQIGQGEAVKLEITQKNDTLQNPDNPGDKPIVNNSQISTTVLVNSGDILVLGGLMSNSLTDSLSKTPILGDIPLLGKLFHHKQHSLEKKNLLVFIHPVILKTPMDGTRISESRYNAMRDVQKDWQLSWLDGEDKPNDRLLPPRNQLLILPSPF